MAAAVTENIEVSDTDTLAQMTEALEAENSEQNEEIPPSLNSTLPVVSLEPSNPSPCESSDPSPTTAAVSAVATSSSIPLFTAADELSNSSNITVVHATVVFQDFLHEILLQEDMDSLQKFIFSEDHLLRNICSIEPHPLSSRDLRSSFKHMIEIRLHVNCSNLWEPAMSYIMKHLGRADYQLQAQ